VGAAPTNQNHWALRMVVRVSSRVGVEEVHAGQGRGRERWLGFFRFPFRLGCVSSEHGRETCLLDLAFYRAAQRQTMEEISTGGTTEEFLGQSSPL
jgi:hypothetical protein